MIESSGFNRKNFKGTSKDELEKSEKDINSKIPVTSSDRVGFHKIKEGKNYFRVYPAKMGDQTFVFPKVVVWLPQMVEEKNDKGQVKKVIKRMPIFNAKVHGDLPFDPTELFFECAKKIVSSQSQDPEDIKNRLEVLTNWKTGIMPQKSWCMYADEWNDIKGSTRTFARLEVFDSLYQEIKKRASAYEEDDEEISDPISDPDTGRLLIITKTTKKDKNGKDKTENEVDLYHKPAILSDEELIKFNTQDALSKFFLKSYKRKDFERTIEGLKLVDDDHEFGVFDDEDFLEKIEELSNMIPEEDSENEEESEKPLSKMTRAELKAFIKEKELPITVRQSMTDDDIRDSINEELEVKKAQKSVDDEEEDDSEKPDKLPFDNEEEEKPKAKEKGSSHVKRIADSKPSDEDDEAEAIDKKMQEKIDKANKSSKK